MANEPATLGSIFASASGVGAADVEDADALEAALIRGWERGGAAWPGVSLDPRVFSAYLGERAQADVAPAAWLGQAPVEDAFLACACCQGLPEAIRAFETAFLSALSRTLATLRPTAELVTEVRQRLLDTLFVDAPGRPPKIRQYGGRGALAVWVRVVAVRIALELVERRHEPAGDDDALASVVDRAADPELELLKESYREPFVVAFRAAMVSLGERERNLLRLTFVEELTPGRVAAVYGVHRTTAMRWIEAAKEEVLTRTRAGLVERLRLSPSECDGIFALVRSRIDITLSSLLEVPEE
jgi:RNA polymerase sigma-70 factor, ECF subfamily